MRTVDDLRLNAEGQPQRYFIANYQRGYRWSTTQVTQLLDDIREFTNRPNPKPEQFYCLQPLVLKVAEGGGFEVVDGQQRLTTLMLILRHFNERLAEEYRDPVFSIEYETRPNLLGFLDTPTKEVADTSADFYHLYNAITAIKEWFSDKGGEVGDLTSSLLKRTKVIWYLLADQENSVEAFTRLNVGKIPLTNDELIRALFLKRAAPDQAEAEDLQRQIANEWDQIEKSLQSDDFWYFISNDKGKTDNRISFLFDLVAKTNGLTDDEERDKYGVFCAFNRRLSELGVTTKSEWREIKNAFMTLDEWFEDRNLYHIIGFLIHEGFGVQAIRTLAGVCKKHEFETAIRRKIFEHVTGHKFPEEDVDDEVRSLINERIEELTYERTVDHRKIRSLLLLFNIATLLENEYSTIRFQFDSFKNQDWHIEHVRSVAPDRLANHSEQAQWLRHSLGYWEAKQEEKELCEDIAEFLKFSKHEVSEDDFAALYKRVIDSFKERNEEQPDHSIANLVLLDQETNQSYKNAVFAVKRQRLLSLDRAGIFVPLCTRNVFLKCYGDQVDHLMSWSERDRESYRNAILETLVGFFSDVQDGDR
tara:strand:- start:4012 stop:5778 length:1767 start_codon:yes stop_codon:yes gene_type:complete